MIILLVIVVTAIIYLVRYSQRPSQTPLLNKRRIVFFASLPDAAHHRGQARWCSCAAGCRAFGSAECLRRFRGGKHTWGFQGFHTGGIELWIFMGYFSLASKILPNFSNIGRLQHEEKQGSEAYIYRALTYSKVNLRSLSASRFVTSGWSKGILGMVIQAVSQVEQDMTPATVKHKKT